MKITNHSNLPLPFVRMAESNYEYKPNRYSATTLLKSTREIILRRRYDGDIEQDCSEMIWLLFGQAVHHILETNANGSNEFAEEKLTVELDNGCTVSGIIDFYDIDKAEVVDYKTCSVWKIKFKDFADWRDQGMIYAWLLRKNGLPCEKVTFYGIMKDHTPQKAKYEVDYPKSPVSRISFDVTEEAIATIEKKIIDKLDEINTYKYERDEDLPMCTEEERWNDGDKYAVMEKGKKRALRVLNSMSEAEEWKQNNGGDFIETRYGEDKKCIDYCLCCTKCDYYRRKYGQS